MSFADKLVKVPGLRALVSTEPGQPPAQTPPAQPAPPPFYVASPTQTAAPPIDPSSPQVQKYYDGLVALMKPVCSQGYGAFLQQLAVLGGILKDDAMLLPAAAAAAGKVGQAEILHEVQDCLDVLAHQRGQLEMALQKKVTGEVGAKQAEITRVQQSIAGLQAQIDAATRQLAQLSADVDNAQRNAERERMSFGVACSRHETELASLRDRAQRFLPAEGGSK